MRTQRTIVTRTCARCDTSFSTNRDRGTRFCSASCAHQGPNARTDVYARLWRRIAKGDGCWEWQGSRNPLGYGRIGSGGKYGRIALAHRVAYESTFGPIPDGSCVLHRCDNPPCCRPDHLFLGSMADNTADMRAKGRMATGQRLPQTRLTEDDRVQLIRLYGGGSATQSQLAARFGVSATTVHRVIHGCA